MPVGCALYFLACYMYIEKHHFVPNVIKKIDLHD